MFVGVVVVVVVVRVSDVCGVNVAIANGEAS